ncbi:MAG: tetratricopeptide repeat protein, partial [Anaerolineae bacterium]
HGESQVFEYLATEVFGQQPDDVQEFLLHSAILDQMSPALCDELLGTESARERLYFLESQNLFVFRLEGPGEWYRLHQLFRGFLLSRLRSTDPQRHRELNLQAAQLFTRRSELAPAIQHYLEAEAYEEAAEIIESVADETFNTGRWTTLARWIDALPWDILLKQPRLMTHQAKVWIQVGRLTDAIRKLDRASEMFQAQGETEHQAEALTIKSVALRIQGRYEEAIDLCEQALELLDCTDSPELGFHYSNSPVAAQAYRNIGIVYGILGKLSDSAEQLTQALHLYEARGEAYHIASVRHDLATTYLRAGDLARASTHYRPALRHWRETANCARISETLNGMGCALYYQGAYETARELLEEALIQARKAQYARAEAAVLAGLGDIARSVAMYDQALSRYKQALRVAEDIREESIIIYVLTAMGLTHCTLGDDNRAWTCVTEALNLGEQYGSAYDIGLSRDALGVLSHTRSELDMAVQHFTEARDHFNACGAKRELAIAVLHLAQALFEKTCSSDAINCLQEVVDLADELGYDYFLISEGRRSVELYKQAVAQQVGNGRLARILEHLGEEVPERRPETDVETISSETEPPLRIQAFGQAQVWLYGEPITKKQWDSATTKELFFYLLAHPDGVRKDKILGVFWPETTPAKASSAFHSTNYRLRRALQRQDCILFKNGVYMINPELSYWFDVDAFQALIEEAKNTESADERASLYVKAIELARGNYLDEFYSDWPFFQREELQRQLFEALAHLAEYYCQNGKAEDALPLYERIVADDPYQEEIHREIMRVHVELGQRAAAVKHYQKLKAFLEEDLDIDPMPETTALYEAILGGGEL